MTSDVKTDVKADVNKDVPNPFVLFDRIGDYPGQGEVSGMAHQGTRACHWCEGSWKKNKAYKG